MYDFVLEIVLMLSLGVMVYLAARALPRVEKTDAHGEERVRSKFDDWLSSLPLDKIDATAAGLAEKYLRKFRVFLLKIENLIDNYLSKVKSTNTARTSSDDEKRDLIGGDDQSKK